MTIKEVAEYLKVHHSTIHKLIRRSGLPAFRIGSAGASIANRSRIGNSMQ
jgi:hypothetical protein